MTRIVGILSILMLITVAMAENFPEGVPKAPYEQDPALQTKYWAFTQYCLSVDGPGGLILPPTFGFYIQGDVNFPDHDTEAGTIGGTWGFRFWKSVFIYGGAEFELNERKFRSDDEKLLVRTKPLLGLQFRGESHSFNLFGYYGFSKTDCWGIDFRAQGFYQKATEKGIYQGLGWYLIANYNAEPGEGYYLDEHPVYYWQKSQNLNCYLNGNMRLQCSNCLNLFPGIYFSYEQSVTDMVYLVNIAQRDWKAISTGASLEADISVGNSIIFINGQAGYSYESNDDDLWNIDITGNNFLATINIGARTFLY